jgi:hypothetical protein
MLQTVHWPRNLSTLTDEDMFKPGIIGAQAEGLKDEQKLEYEQTGQESLPQILFRVQIQGIRLPEKTPAGGE